MKTNNIADLLKKGAMLAPMAGVTDLPFRKICLEMGCAYVCTEMVSAKGWVMSHENAAQELLMASDPAEAGKASLQIFGHEPEVIAAAADALTARSPWANLDINMGCPMPKIVNHGDGSALMKDPRLAEEVISAAVAASHVPVSIKFRIGYTEKLRNYIRIAEIAEKCGVSFLTLHARTKDSSTVVKLTGMRSKS